MKQARAWILWATILASLILQSPPVLSGPLDPYIERAKKEGSVKLGVSLRKMRYGKPAAIKYFKAFKNRYPFLKVKFKRIGGPPERERVLSEMTSGVVNFDVATVSETMVPTMIKAKIARVVEWRKLGIPKLLAHPKNVGISLRTPVYGIAYNRELVPDEIGKALSWESCTDPKWKGKTVAEARPRHLNTLYQDDGWGKEKTLDYAKRWVANKPTVEASRGAGVQKLAVGAYHIYCGMARKNVKEQAFYGGVPTVGFAYPEPVPVGIGDIIYVPRKAKHPNAAILFLAWSATREAQNLLDDVDFTGHPAFQGNDVNRMLEGKKIVFGSWEYTDRSDEILTEILQAMGFPVVR